MTHGTCKHETCRIPSARLSNQARKVTTFTGESLHLDVRHSLISARKTRDESLVQIQFFWDVVCGRLPLAGASTEVDGIRQTTLAVEIERLWDVHFDNMPGAFAKRLAKKRLEC